MFQPVRTLLDMLRILRTGEDVGDAAVLKLTLVSKRETPSDYTAQALRTEQQNFEPLFIDALAELPEGTFGHAYSVFMKDHKLSPLNFSPRVRELFARYPVSIRYVRLHDMIHVLLGLGPDIPGEVGVYAFVREQNYNRTLNRAAATANLFSYLMFWSRPASKRAQARARALATHAKILIAEPLEDMLDQPLDEVRAALGLVA